MIKTCRETTKDFSKYSPSFGKECVVRNFKFSPLVENDGRFRIWKMSFVCSLAHILPDKNLKMKNYLIWLAKSKQIIYAIRFSLMCKTKTPLISQHVAIKFEWWTFWFDSRFHWKLFVHNSPRLFNFTMNAIFYNKNVFLMMKQQKN